MPASSGRARDSVRASVSVQDRGGRLERQRANAASKRRACTRVYVQCAVRARSEVPLDHSLSSTRPMPTRTACGVPSGCGDHRSAGCASIKALVGSDSDMRRNSIREADGNRTAPAEGSPPHRFEDGRAPPGNASSHRGRYAASQLRGRYADTCTANIRDNGERSATPKQQCSTARPMTSVIARLPRNDTTDHRRRPRGRERRRAVEHEPGVTQPRVGEESGERPPGSRPRIVVTCGSEEHAEGRGTPRRGPCSSRRSGRPRRTLPWSPPDPWHIGIHRSVRDTALPMPTPRIAGGVTRDARSPKYTCATSLTATTALPNVRGAAG